MEGTGSEGFSSEMSSENKDASKLVFQQRLAEIQSTPLSVENVDSYADSALSDMIRLTTGVVTAYRRECPSLVFEQDKDWEDHAFSYFHLNNISEILDTIHLQSQKITDIDALMEHAKQVETTIPPESKTSPIIEGSGTYHEKQIIPRVKTILLSLSNDFSVDLKDPEQLSLTKGVIPDNSMRASSYFMIEASSLQRTILCCDEEGNATYVFDNNVLTHHGISPGDIATLTKQEINDLLRDDPAMGRRVVYSANTFVSRMVDLMTDIQADERVVNSSAGSYLYPQAPEGISSAWKIAKELGVARNSVVKAIDSLGESLGEAGKFKFGTKNTIGYNPGQVEVIRKSLEQEGFLTLHAPDDTLSVPGISRKLGVSEGTVLRIIDSLGESLGEAGKFKFGTKNTIGYNLGQVEVIREAMEQKGAFSIQAPDGFLSAFGIANKLGVENSTIMKIADSLKDSLGEVGQYKFGTNNTIGYNPDQVEMIREAVEQKGLLSLPAPENVLSTYGLSILLGVRTETIIKVIDSLGSSLGEVGKFKFGSRVAKGVNPDQVEVIKNFLEQEKP